MINVTPGATDFLQQTVTPQTQGPTIAVQPQACPQPDIGKVAQAAAEAARPLVTVAAGAIVGALAYYFVPRILDKWNSPPDEYSIDETDLDYE